ncbi:MAG: adenosylcobinamide-GDP ribazoletransferase [Hyphomicrobium sp.]
MIAHEWRLFLVALQFMTRLPLKSVNEFDPAWLDWSAKYFPLVGAVVGALGAAVIVSSSAVLPQPLPMLFGVVTCIAITGGLHEDGLADTADAFGGGQTLERRLEIMKDSRIGTYGALALISMLAIKATALLSIGPIQMALALIAAHAAARLATVIAIRLMPYAGDVAAAKVKPLATGATGSGLALALVFGMLPGFALLNTVTFTISILTASLAAGLLAYQSKRLIGGYTGDVLGAIEQVFETAFLVAAAAVIAGPG